AHHRAVPGDNARRCRPWSVWCERRHRAAAGARRAGHRGHLRAGGPGRADRLRGLPGSPPRPRRRRDLRGHRGRRAGRGWCPRAGRGGGGAAGGRRAQCADGAAAGASRGGTGGAGGRGAGRRRDGAPPGGVGALHPRRLRLPGADGDVARRRWRAARVGCVDGGGGRRRGGGARGGAAADARRRGAPDHRGRGGGGRDDRGGHPAGAGGGVRGGGGAGGTGRRAGGGAGGGDAVGGRRHRAQGALRRGRGRVRLAAARLPRRGAHRRHRGGGHLRPRRRGGGGDVRGGARGAGRRVEAGGMTAGRGGRAWLAAVAVVALVAALAPAWLSAGDLGDVAVAVTRGALGAAAAVAVAVGRPSLAVAGIAGVAGYASGDAAMHGWAVPLAMLAGIGLGALTSVVLGLAGARLGAAGFVALTLVATLAGGALVDALPYTLGGTSGLQPVPGLSVPLPGGDTLAFGPAGTVHLTLLLVAAGVIACGLMLRALPGARWRAIGGDPERALDAGLRPLRGTLVALAVSGALAGLGGVLAVHATGVATPSSFSVDAAVLPLLAAMLAARGGPAAAALAGAATGALGLRVLPALGWTGPPGAEALATGVLAAVTLVALAGGRRVRALWPGRAVDGGDAATDAAGEEEEPRWPPMQPLGGRAGLLVRGFDVVPERGAAPLAQLELAVPSGAVQGLAGANGAGKSTALRGIASALRRGGDPAVRFEPAGARARAVLLPQQGGGWPGCTVGETLRLAARAGHRSGAEARQAADAWAAALDLDGAWDTPCESLSHGVRRRVELARVLLLRPAVLLCDEPLAGLDGADRERTLDCLRSAAGQGVTVVVAEHDRASLARIAAATTELRRLDLDGGGEPAPGAAPA